MSTRKNHRFSEPVTVLHGQRLPEPAMPAGLAALIDAYGLAVPVPLTLAAVGARHKTYVANGWRIFTPRHAPSATLEGHLTFALKYEAMDLAVLKRLFLASGSSPIEALVRATPTGGYARRIWFLYEWLLGDRLDLPDLARGSYVDALDPALQFAGRSRNSPRHRVRDNLPGTPAFCPLVTRTRKLEALIASGLADRARTIAADVPADLLARAAAFLLLQDSRASYAIEGEAPGQNRIQRWGRAIRDAGKRPIDLDELLRLQQIVIGNARFVRMGLRVAGGFVGEHDRVTRAPLPQHISARPQDLTSLIAGMIAFDREQAEALDAVIAAAVLAFGFVFVHPFEDGNGRIHRYLIHHVLAARGFNPPGVVFPVSSTILDRIEAYRIVLESYSRRVLPLIEWRATADGNVAVLSDTADFYRYFDATPQAEFLYACVERTVEEELPREAEFLRRHDDFRARLGEIVDMPDRSIDLLLRLLRQNDGLLSKRARKHELSALLPAEVEAIESAYAEAYADG